MSRTDANLHPRKALSTRIISYYLAGESLLVRICVRLFAVINQTACCLMLDYKIIKTRLKIREIARRLPCGPAQGSSVERSTQYTL